MNLEITFSIMNNIINDLYSYNKDYFRDKFTIDIWNKYKDDQQFISECEKLIRIKLSEPGRDKFINISIPDQETLENFYNLYMISPKTIYERSSLRLLSLKKLFESQVEDYLESGDPAFIEMLFDKLENYSNILECTKNNLDDYCIQLKEMINEES